MAISKNETSTIKTYTVTAYTIHSSASISVTQAAGPCTPTVYVYTASINTSVSNVACEGQTISISTTSTKKISGTTEEIPIDFATNGTSHAAQAGVYVEPVTIPQATAINTSQNYTYEITNEGASDTATVTQEPYGYFTGGGGLGNLVKGQSYTFTNQKGCDRQSEFGGVTGFGYGLMSGFWYNTNSFGFTCTGTGSGLGGGTISSSEAGVSFNFSFNGTD